MTRNWFMCSVVFGAAVFATVGMLVDAFQHGYANYWGLWVLASIFCLIAGASLLALLDDLGWWPTSRIQGNKERSERDAT